jgi:hypothetical protein
LWAPHATPAFQSQFILGTLSFFIHIFLCLHQVNSYSWIKLFSPGTSSDPFSHILIPRWNKCLSSCSPGSLGHIPLSLYLLGYVHIISSYSIISFKGKERFLCSSIHPLHLTLGT